LGTGASYLGAAGAAYFMDSYLGES
jgi:hypothetical protein